MGAATRVVASMVLAAALAQGHCPHQCSGHGRCGEVSRCECFTTWAGGDCSQRAYIEQATRSAKWCYGVRLSDAHSSLPSAGRFGLLPFDIAGKCPTGSAWADIAIGTDIAHQPSLCSNRGICETTTGQCKCMEGYEGLGCSRSELPPLCLPGSCAPHAASADIAQMWSMSTPSMFDSTFAQLVQ